MQNQAKRAPKEHYHLVAGEVIFVTDPEGPNPESGSVRLNCMLQTKDGLIRHRQLGQAQQILQMLFHKRLEEQNAQVIDVFIHGISFLGVMTEEEFNLAPEGMQLVEQASEDVIPDILKN